MGMALQPSHCTPTCTSCAPAVDPGPGSCRGRLPPGLAASITPALEAQLARIAARHADILRELEGDQMSHMAPPEIARLSKELAELAPVVLAAAELAAIKAEVGGAGAGARARERVLLSCAGWQCRAFSPTLTLPRVRRLNRVLAQSAADG